LNFYLQFEYLRRFEEAVQSSPGEVDEDELWKSVVGAKKNRLYGLGRLGKLTSPGSSGSSSSTQSRADVSQLRADMEAQKADFEVQKADFEARLEAQKKLSRKRSLFSGRSIRRRRIHRFHLRFP
jgi:hypothetical protein